MKFWIFAILTSFMLPGNPHIVVSESPGECSVTAIGSVETYLKMFYSHEDPGNPGSLYVYTGPISILSNETASVAYDWQPVAFEWYYKPYGAMVDSEIVSEDPINNVYEGEYRLGYACGAIPSPDYFLIEPNPVPDLFNGLHEIPGRVEAEDFNVGGEGVAYSDSTPLNLGDSIYREAEAVDIKTISGLEDNGHAVGWVTAGEWMEYTIRVTKTGTYDFGFRVLSAAEAGEFFVEIDGEDIGDPISVPYTGEWNTDSWTTVVVPGVFLAIGDHVLRVETTSGRYDFNFFEVTVAGICPARVIGSVEAYLKVYYLHEDPESPGYRFIYVSENVISEDADLGVNYAAYPAVVEWWYRPYGSIVASNGDFILGRRCGEMPEGSALLIGTGRNVFEVLARK